jgi:hypothetical protein
VTTRRLFGQWRDDEGGDRLHVGAFGDAILAMPAGMTAFTLGAAAETELVLRQRTQDRVFRSPLRFDGDDAIVLEPGDDSLFQRSVRLVREPVTAGLTLPSLAFHALWTGVAMAEAKVPRFMPFMLLETAAEHTHAPIWADSAQECVALAMTMFEERRGSLTRFAFVTDSVIDGPDGEEDAVVSHVWMPRADAESYAALYALGTPSHVLRHGRTRSTLTWLVDRE